ncbi:MAG: calcium-binding protein [Rhizobiaceae bacterium]|nr:calcium-binding protein [Rhizobiaceae bacterium]
MAKKITADRFETWTIDGDDKTWIVEKQATIAVEGANAIDILATSTGNVLDIRGDLSADGAFNRAINVQGADNTIKIGRSAHLEAHSGIYGSADGLSVVNRGEIDADSVGISANGTAMIRNHGSIDGLIGIETHGGARIVNGEYGIIDGKYGVYASGNGESVFINRGKVLGDTYAVNLSVSDGAKLVNTGTIKGDIALGSGNDVLQSWRGKIDGAVYGGDGNDTYRIGKNDIDISESADSGYDRVYAKITQYLGENVEALYLKGKKDIDGHGNDDGNTISGNKGDNVLTGQHGNDTLHGGRGNDFLIGGSDQDTFRFNRGDDRDVIDDFVSGQDLIWMTGFKGVDEFADLAPHMSQHGNDTWLQMGKGDRLIIENVDMNDLDASDFSFALV